MSDVMSDTNPAAFCSPVERDLVVVHGPDATSFLQSLISQDLDPIAVGDAAPSLLLQPQGKLLVDFVIRRHRDEEWWCLCEGGFGATLADGLNRFKIRVKAEVELRPVAALAVRGQAPPADAGAVVAIPVSWGEVPAYDAVGTDVAIDEFRAGLALPAVDSVTYERARIEAGVPRLGADLDEKTIPQEAGLERHAVSFTKGCFVGQELVCRIDSRGHVNRLLRRLRADAPMTPGAEVSADGKTVGLVTSAAGDVALAMVRREVVPGARVSAAGVDAIVEAGAVLDA
jgi:folate-binding protein YgfZ